MEALGKKAPGGTWDITHHCHQESVFWNETVKSQSGNITGKWGKADVVISNILYMWAP